MTMAGLVNGVIEGSRGVKIVPDCEIEQADSKDCDMIILPGGQPGTTNLQNNDRVKQIICEMNEAGKTIAAICAAPLILQSAGILKGRVVTCHPSVRDQLHEVELSESRVEVDGNLITSQSPGTAMEFALKLIEVLFGKERLAVVEKGVLPKK